MPLDKNSNIFIHDCNEIINEVIDIGDYRLGYFCSKSKVKTSEDNEDCLFMSVKKNGLRIGVADGAGGHPRGRDASYTIAESFIQDSSQNIGELINSINQKVIDLKVGAKSTFALADIIDGDISFYCVGDSEVLYWNAQGKMIYSSTPHSITGMKVKSGVIDQTQSLQDPDRHYVQNLVGDEFIRIESTSKFQLKKGHTILIGTDGIFDNLSHVELEQMASNGQFEKSFEELVEKCSEQDEKMWLKEDDIAFILFRKVKA